MAIILRAYNVSLEPNISINTTSWILGNNTNTTITVNVGPNNSPYNGPINISYSNGISGPASATCNNGTVSIQINRSEPTTATLSITVPKNGNIKEKTQTFTGSMSGQTVYIEGDKATRYTVARIQPEGETGDAGGCLSSYTTYSLTVNGVSLYNSQRAPSFPIWVNGVGYNRGSVEDTYSWTSSTPITCKGSRRYTYYSVIFV